MASHLAAQVLWVLGGVYALLVVASLVQWAMQRRRPERDLRELRSRIRSWWVMVTLFTAAMLLSPTASVVFFAFVSFLAFKEYLSIIPTRRADRRVLFWAYLTIPVQYAWVGAGQYGLFIVFIPVYAFLLLPIRMVIIGETRDFLRAAGTLHWGLMATVFSISHVAYLLVLPGGNASAVAGGAGLVLYLLALTELNDVAQYVWGKSFGRHRIIPKVSPNKTWEGFVGGVATTVLLAVLLAPLLTPFTWPMAMAAGLIIGLGGFVGDVTISAVKRDLGVKDSGSVLPGHGGILDRVDSLTYTAPLFLHFTRYFYYS